MAGRASIDQIQENLNEFYRSGRSELTPCCDLGELIGPVEIFATDGLCMGYGLRTTRDVKKGEFLMISKAIASCVREYEIKPRRAEANPWTVKSVAEYLGVDTDRSGSSSTDDDSVPGRFDEDFHEANESRVPQDVSEVLVRGIKEGLTVARRYQIHTLQNNMFKRDGKYSKAHLDADFYGDVVVNDSADGNQHRPSVNKTLLAHQAQKGYLPGFVARNASYDDVKWREELEAASTSSSDPGYQVKNAEFWGVWLLPSFINHSCTPNCRRQRAGDFLDVRARVDIDVGEMLTLPYFNIFKPISVRNESSKQWGFRCCCSRCTLERGFNNPRLLETERDMLQMYQLFESLLRGPNPHEHLETFQQTLNVIGGLTVAIDEELEKCGSKEAADIPESSAEHQQHHSQSTGGEGSKSSAGGGAEQFHRTCKIAEEGAAKLSSEKVEGGAEQSFGKMAEAGAESFNKENAEEGAQQSTSVVLKGMDERDLDGSTSEHPHHESRNVEDSKKARKAAKKKKRKAEKKEMSSKISAQLIDMDQVSESVRAIWEKRSFIKDGASRKQIAVAEGHIREIYVAAAQGDSEGGASATVQHWGHTDRNPFDQIWSSLDPKFLKQNILRNPLYYYVKASFFDAYLATFALETARAAQVLRDADAIVSYIAAINILLDMLNVLTMTVGCTDLATELMLQFTLNFEALYAKLPARTSAVSLRILEECLVWQKKVLK